MAQQIELILPGRQTGHRDAAPGAAARGGIAPAILLSLLALAGILLLQVFSVQPGQPGAIVFPSGISEAQAFDSVIAAGGKPVRAARSRLFGDVVWLAAADDPDFFTRVVGSGAMLVMNPFAFGGCLLEQP